MYRIAAAVAALAVSTVPVLADPEVSVTLGLMQRSYGADVPVLTDGFGTTFLSSAGTETAGISVDAQVMGDNSWARLMVYADGFDTTVSDSTAPFGIGFPVQPGSVGLFGGAGPAIAADFERETGLLRLDIMRDIPGFAGFDLYAGPSFVQISDDLGAVFTASGFPGTANDVDFRGRSRMIGAVLGARRALNAGDLFNGIALEGFGTLGVYRASHTMDYSSVGSGLLSIINESANASATSLTGAVELGLTAAYSLSETSEITLTYQAAYYADAVASPQSIASTSRAPLSTAVFTDGLLYQGLSVGYRMRF